MKSAHAAGGDYQGGGYQGGGARATADLIEEALA
jgi:hypothetical protein